ncbi:MAG: serine acetyltransferase [Ignavibacteriales bacterium]|nr:serine acetyltransferase [Ignavibacteriales bacterium]
MQINTKNDLRYFLEADRLALNRTKRKSKFVSSIFSPDYIWKFQKFLRYYEYLNNKKKNILEKLFIYLIKFRFNKLSLKLGFSIPINAFGPGLSIAHIGPIIINSSAKIGNNCRIHVGTNIGTEAGYADKAPILGNNIYIGPGAVLFGAITIANNCAIGANAVVNKDFLNESKVIAGVPAKEIGGIDIKTINILATKIIDLKINKSLIVGLTAKEICQKLGK